jgi:hypothetical protein
MNWQRFIDPLDLGWDPLGLFKTAKQTPPSPDAFQVTTADEGGVIPVLWGTRDIKSIEITYFGDVKTVAIKKSGGKK